MPDNNDMDYQDESDDSSVEDIGANIEEDQTSAEESEEAANIQTDTSVSQKDKKNKGTETELHYQALDLIGSVLSKDYKGDKVKFFKEHPKLAEKANRSVRYKEDYRELMESESKDTSENMEVEEKDLDEVADMVYSKITEKSQSDQRQKLTKEFAEKEGINKDDIKVLNEAAEALHKATKQPFAKCLEGAKQTLQATLKPKSPLKMPSGGGMTIENDKKEAEISRIMETHGVSKQQAEKYLKNNKGYDGSLGQWASN